MFDIYIDGVLVIRRLEASSLSDVLKVLAEEGKRFIAIPVQSHR
jgi:hypothetical protein